MWIKTLPDFFIKNFMTKYIKPLKYLLIVILICLLFWPVKTYRIVVSDPDSVMVEPELMLEPADRAAPPVILEPKPEPEIKQSFRASPSKESYLPSPKTVTSYRPVSPEDLPNTKPWYYRGKGTLKDHIHNIHNTAYPMMVLFETESDLKKLHSFLHNGGDLNSVQRKK